MIDTAVSSFLIYMYSWIIGDVNVGDLTSGGIKPQCPQVKMPMHVTIRRWDIWGFPR
jgi:hypothetical protein